MNRVIIHAHRDKYSPDEVRGLTAEELISILERCEPDAVVVLSFDGGYTYGGIQEDDVEEI